MLAASNVITFQRLRYAETKLLKPGKHVATWFDRTVKSAEQVETDVTLLPFFGKQRPFRDMRDGFEVAFHQDVSRKRKYDSLQTHAWEASFGARTGFPSSRRKIARVENQDAGEWAVKD